MITKAFTIRASSIGDCLMGKYFLENIHAAYPNAQCFLVVASSGTMIRSLFAAYPWITVIEANRKKPLSLLRVYMALRGAEAGETQYSVGGRFSFPSKLFARLVTRRGGLVGFDDGHSLNRFLYDKLLVCNLENPVFTREQDAVRALGVPLSVHELSYEYVHDDSALEKFGFSENGYVLLHLASGSDQRTLRPEKRREIAHAVSQFCVDRGLLLGITGTEKEWEKYKEAYDGLPVVVLAGKTSVQELANLIARSFAVVSLDTGVSHLAAHMKKQVVVLTSYQGTIWWTKTQYPENTRVLTAPKGPEETIDKVRLYPPSLNDIPAQSVLAALESFA